MTDRRRDTARRPDRRPGRALAVAAHAERRVRRGRRSTGPTCRCRSSASGSRRPSRGLVALGFAGANVTIPHKTAVVGFCDELDDVAERAGSVNTLVVRDGRVLGSSTDGPAVVGSSRRREPACSCSARAGEHRPWRRRSATRARSRSRSRRATRSGRTRSPSGCARSSRSGRSRPRATGPRAPGRDPARQRDADPGRGPRPASAEQQVVDLAVQAGRLARPRWCAAAREAGCTRVVDGLEVLLAQGAASFERWTGDRSARRVERRCARALGRALRSLSHRLCGGAHADDSRRVPRPRARGIVTGLPAGLVLDRAAIEADLRRRQQGYGRSPRQQIETDTVEVLAGLRHGRTLGTPLALLVRNRDHKNWEWGMSPWPPEGEPDGKGKEPVTLPRPGPRRPRGRHEVRALATRATRSSARARATRRRSSPAGAVAKALLARDRHRSRPGAVVGDDLESRDRRGAGRPRHRRRHRRGAGAGRSARASARTRRRRTGSTRASPGR